MCVYNKIDKMFIDIYNFITYMFIDIYNITYI